VTALTPEEREAVGAAIGADQPRPDSERIARIAQAITPGAPSAELAMSAVGFALGYLSRSPEVTALREALMECRERLKRRDWCAEYDDASVQRCVFVDATLCAKLDALLGGQP
jgi:hypothetical protein